MILAFLHESISNFVIHSQYPHFLQKLSWGFYRSLLGLGPKFLCTKYFLQSHVWSLRWSNCRIGEYYVDMKNTIFYWIMHSGFSLHCKNCGVLPIFTQVFILLWFSFSWCYFNAVWCYFFRVVLFCLFVFLFCEILPKNLWKKGLMKTLHFKNSV